MGVGIGGSDRTVEGWNHRLGSVFSSKAGASGEGTGIEDQRIDLICGASMGVQKVALMREEASYLQRIPAVQARCMSSF